MLCNINIALPEMSNFQKTLEHFSISLPKAIPGSKVGSRLLMQVCHGEANGQLNWRTMSQQAFNAWSRSFISLLNTKHRVFPHLAHERSCVFFLESECIMSLELLDSIFLLQVGNLRGTNHQTAGDSCMFRPGPGSCSAPMGCP